MIRTLLRELGIAITIVAGVILACFAFGWCLGWVRVGFCMSAGCA